MIYRWIRRRVVFVAIGVVAGVLALAGAAWAYWSAQAGNVPAYAQADTMGGGARPTASVSGGTATVSWSAATTAGGHAVGGYLVQRYTTAIGGTAVAAAQGTCAATPVAATSCAEPNLPAGTWYYTVTPMLGNWRGAESPRANAVTTSDTYVLSLPGGTTTLAAGGATTLTITATAAGQTDVGYGGAHTLAFSGPGTSPNGTAPSYNNGNTSVTFTNGVASVPMTLYKAESRTLTVASTNTSGGIALTVQPGTAGAFGVTTPSTATAGTAQTVSVTAQDAYGNTATAYTGGKTLTWSGPATAPGGQKPSYPANSVTFTNGATGNLSATFVAAQTTTLTVTDGSISGTSSAFTVTGATATRFGLSQPGTQASGTGFTVTVTAIDTYGNTATGYTGGNLTFTGPGTAPDGATPNYPSNPVAFTNGVASVSVTLVKAESVTLAVAAGTLTGQTASAITVTAGAPSNLAWTSASAGGGTLGSPCLFTCSATGMNNKTFTASVSLTDSHGNIVSGLGTAQTVTVTATAGTGDPLGTFTAPPPGGTAVTLTIPATGPATSTASLAYKAPNGSWTSNKLTATTTGNYISATATFGH